MTEGLLLDYTTRLDLAKEAVDMRFESRNSFISDDDLLDIADDWTTDLHHTDEEIDAWIAVGADPDSPMLDRPDRSALLEALYVYVVGHDIDAT